MKKGLVAALAVACSLIMATPAFAGTWLKDGMGWWYQHSDGSYPVNTWEWIDGNNDGVAECYYFNNLGYCVQNRMTPDGYTVNSDGAWTINGVVQTQGVKQSQANGRVFHFARLESHYANGQTFYSLHGEDQHFNTLWVKELGGRMETELSSCSILGIAPERGRIYVADRGYVIAYDGNSGTELWRTYIGVNGLSGGDDYTDGSVFAIGFYDDTLYKISPNGNVVFKVPMPDGYYWSTFNRIKNNRVEVLCEMSSNPPYEGPFSVIVNGFTGEIEGIYD